MAEVFLETPVGAERQTEEGAVDKSFDLGPVDLGRQTRNLLLARPLHDLAAKVRRADYGGGEFQSIDTNFLALSLFDYIMEGSVFGLGRLREEVLTFLADLVRQMNGGGLSYERCNELAVEVVDSLHNTDSRNEQFDFPYYDAVDGKVKGYRFSLLTFERQDDNQYKYRLTDAAILLYVGQLDIGAEQMQTLLDRMLAELVKRGRVSEALDVSRQAYLQAVRYQDSIRSRLDRAERVPDSIRWKKDLAPFIDDSRSHIDERSNEGRSLLTLLKEKIVETSNAISLERLIKLREMVERESVIHLNLLRQVSEAGDKYLRASKTMFRARVRHNLPDLEEKVLPQVLRLNQTALTEVSRKAGYALLPPAVDRIFNLRQVIELLIEPQAEAQPKPDTPDVFEPRAEETPHFTEEVIKAGDAYLHGVFASQAPVYMDEILSQAHAEGVGSAVCDYMVFMLYQSYNKDEDAFGVTATPEGRFNLSRVEGSRLHFTHRDKNGSK